MIFITDFIENPGIERNILGSHLVGQKSEDVKVLLVWHQSIDEEYLANFPNLKGVVRYGVGFDNIDLNLCKKRGIICCNTPDYGVDEVSDTALSMALCGARNILGYNFNSRLLEGDIWQNSYSPELKRSNQTKFGVLGAGRIGSSVALKAQAIGYQTAIYDPYRESGVEKVLKSTRYDCLTEFLAEMDIVSIHTPLNEETIGMVNEDFVRKMKNGAIFVNSARGKIVSDIDIFRRPLLEGKLSFVGLDVLPSEPPKNSPLIEMWKKQDPAIAGKLVINPHTAFYSQSASIDMRASAAKNALRILNDQTAKNIIV